MPVENYDSVITAILLPFFYFLALHVLLLIEGKVRQKRHIFGITSHVLCKHSNGEQASLENSKIDYCWHALSLAKA